MLLDDVRPGYLLSAPITYSNFYYVYPILKERNQITFDRNELVLDERVPDRAECSLLIATLSLLLDECIYYALK